MTDIEISQKAREAEQRISAIINEFTDKTGIENFSPTINFCIDNGKKSAYFRLNATKTF